MGGAASKAAAEQQRALRATPHKLTYFFIAGPCFATRVCLRKAGVPFTDERLIIDVTWPTYPKEHLLMGTLPALTIGDHGTFSQSVPLSRYAAQLAGLYPTSPLEALVSEEVVAILTEAWDKGRAVPRSEVARAAYARETAPRYMRAIAERLGKNDFFGGAPEPLWADLWMYAYWKMFTGGFYELMPEGWIDDVAPALTAHARRVAASPLYLAHGTPE